MQFKINPNDRNINGGVEGVLEYIGLVGNHCVTELNMCGSGCLLQVQPAGLPLPECRHHAKPTVWCKSLLQRPLLQVLCWVYMLSFQLLKPTKTTKLQSLFQTSIAASVELRFLWHLHCSRIITMFATGEGILTQKDRVTADGLQDVFTTNLFGHFLLVSDGYFGYRIV